MFCARVPSTEDEDHLRSRGGGDPSFDGGLYAHRMSGQRYLVSVGKDYPLDFFGLSITLKDVDTPQLNVPAGREPMLVYPAEKK